MHSFATVVNAACTAVLLAHQTCALPVPLPSSTATANIQHQTPTHIHSAATVARNATTVTTAAAAVAMQSAPQSHSKQPVQLPAPQSQPFFQSQWSHLQHPASDTARHWPYANSASIPGKVVQGFSNMWGTSPQAVAPISSTTPPIAATAAATTTATTTTATTTTNSGGLRWFSDGFAFLTALAYSIPGAMTRGVPAIFQQPSYGQPRMGPSKFDLPKMMCLINTERARYSLPPLSVHSKLMEMARRHSIYMSAMRRMTHADSSGSLGMRATQVGFDWDFLEENVASSAQSEEEAMRALMASPAHRMNILSRNVEFFGVAVSDGYWTQEFGNSMDRKYAPRYLDYCPAAHNLVMYY